MNRFLLKFLLVFAVLTISITFTLPASAYTGVYGIFPSIAGGPSHTTVTQFKLDTSSGPHTITTGLFYVQSITITTSEPINSHILIKEYPEGSGTAFDIIVPKKVQDALVSATLTIWAPDTETLVVEHDHKGAPIVYEAATKIIPEQIDGNGNVLWSFTVNSFSSFTPFESIAHAMQPDQIFSPSLVLSLLLLILVSAAAPLALRRN